MSPSKHPKLLFVLVLLAGTVVGAVTNGLIDLGDSLYGEIEDIHQVDTYVFDAVADTMLSVTVRAAGEDKTLQPRLRIEDLTSGDVLVDATNGSYVSVKKLLLPTTGQYRISVSGANDTLGQYKMKTHDKLTWALFPKGWDVAPGGGGTLDLSFDADEGWSMEAKAVPKQIGVYLSSPTLTAPSGADIDLSAHLSKNGPAVHIQDLVLPEFGTYELSIVNSGITGLTRWWIKLDPDED